MFTVCSKCNLRLTVTATDLRAAQGYVRCGRCHNVFNALAALADDPARQGEAEGTATATQSRPALTPPPEPRDPPQPQSLQPIAPATSAADTSPTDTQLEFNPASTNINEVFIEATPGERTGTFESIILVGEDPDSADSRPDAVIAPQALSGPAALLPIDHSVTVDVRSMRDALADPDLNRPVPPEAAASEAAGGTAATDPAQPASTSADAGADIEFDIDFDTVPDADSSANRGADSNMAPDTWATASAGPEPSVDPDAANEIIRALPAADTNSSDADSGASTVLAALRDLEPEPAAARHSHLPRWVLQGTVAVLVLCLFGQVVHHYRARLAGTALLRGPLTALYQALGQPLQPRWNIADYEIRQLGATSDGEPAGELVVRASISNRATRDQPLPLLRVVMQDRFGNRVAARDLKPAEYLGRGAPHVSLMAPGQRVDAQVAFQDPGQTATGFEIDACMASRYGTVTCANDPGRH